MWDIAYYLLIMILLAASLVAFGVLARGYLSGNLAAFLMFAPRPEPRIDVVEQSSIDGKRKLVLIRRDDVEHLIMTGGPVDVVIETGIGPRRLRTAEVVEAPQPAFARQTRNFSQAAGE
jgi:hypothetical protein